VKLSAAILNWNRPADTQVTVASLLRQTVPPDEILVWDNASSDDSVATLTACYRDHPSVRVVGASANFGVAGGRNRAFAEARGDVVISLDNDVWLENDDALEKVRDELERRPDVGVLSFELKRPDGHLMWPFARPASEWRRRTFEAIRIDGGGCAMRREVFEKAGGFPEHFSPYGAEDAHFAYRAMAAGYRLLYFPEVVAVHAFSPKGRTPEQFTMHVRNLLSIPLELFPAPRHLISAARQALSLFREAAELGQVPAFLRGCRAAVAQARRAGRQPVSRETWARIRGLVREDKKASRPG
jgi:GT2 family glycosyltransferase